MCIRDSTKEYHVFDRVYGLNKNRIQGHNPSNNPVRSRIEKFELDTELYFDYFQSLLEEPPQPAYTGDFTPLYAALPKEGYESISKGFRSRNIKVKVVFLMRDPVDRIWSQFRMRRRNGKVTESNHSEDEQLLQFYDLPGVALRTRYENTISRLEQVFDKQGIFYCLFEELFSDDSANALQNFLGLTDLVFDCESKLNESPKSIPRLSTKTKHTIASYYKNTYEYCNLHFNAGDRWESFNYLSFAAT